MYAVTDGFSGLNGSWQTPGTGMNFLMHNMVSHCAADGPASTCESYAAWGVPILRSAVVHTALVRTGLCHHVTAECAKRAERLCCH